MLFLRLIIVIFFINFNALANKAHRHDKDFQDLIKICQEHPSVDFFDLISDHLGRNKQSRSPASVRKTQTYYTEELCALHLIDLFLDKNSISK